MAFNINILSQAPDDGTSFYRAWGPFADVRKIRGVEISEERQINWRTLRQFDLLYMQRPQSEAHIKIMETAKMSGVPVWVDYDDDLLNLPHYHFLYHSISQDVNTISRIIQMADILTVSTEGLKMNWEHLRKDIIIIENYIPLSLPLAKRRPFADSFKIIWRGSRTHDTDWLYALPEFKQFLSEHPGIELILCGEPPAQLHQELEGLCTITTQPVREILDMFRYFGIAPAHIGFIPLSPHRFNEAKSNIAWQEFLTGGMLSVVPNGWLPKRPSNYYDQLTQLYDLWHNNPSGIDDMLAHERERMQYQKLSALKAREMLINRIMYPKGKRLLQLFK